MNLVGAMVGVTITAISSPMIADIALMPVITQAKSNNFSIAEGKANLFAATSRHKGQVIATPTDCTYTDLGEDVHEIVCVEGEGKLMQQAKRSFEIITTDPGGNTSTPDPDGDHDTDDGTALWEGDSSTSGHEESTGDWHWRNDYGRNHSKNSGCDKNR